MPELNLLPFTGGGMMPVQYYVDYEGHSYYIHYRRGWLSIHRDFDVYDGKSDTETKIFEQKLSINENDYDGEWSDEETTVYLALISEAIRRNQIVRLHLPTRKEAVLHPLYVKGPLPLREVMTHENKESV